MLTISRLKFVPIWCGNMLAWLVLYRNQINVLPVCVDSSDSVTKRSGLEVYYQTAIDPETKLPIVNLLNIIESELILNLKKITILTWLLGPVNIHSSLVCSMVIGGKTIWTENYLPNDQWERIKDLLPGKKSSLGKIGRDSRLFIEAVLWIARTGSPWPGLLPAFGNWHSV